MKWLFLFYCLFSHFDYKDLYRDIEIAEQATCSTPSLLQQPFIYLGEGSQMLVFASQDDTYVLKLFKGHHRKSFKFSRFFSHLRRSKADWEAADRRWKSKFSDTCRRYEMAFKDLKEETGLVLLHFHKTTVPIPVTLHDKSTYRVDLAELPFILQKKAVLAPEYFRQNPTKHLEAVHSLKDFFIRRTQKGFSDPRQSLSINYGFIDDAPIQIDAGKIERFDGDIDAEVKKIHAHIDAWASKF